MTITALYVAANEGANIAESMRSVKAYVDRFVVVDSIFTSNPERHTHSCDDQRVAAEDAARPIPLDYFASDAKMTETEARNLALLNVGHGDWGLIIDGDECLYGDHAAVLELLETLDYVMSVAIPVYTTAVLHNGDAPSMTVDEYETKPLISTSSFMVRLFQMEPGLHYELPSGHITPMLTKGDGSVLAADIQSTAALLINRHATQPYDVYQNDYVWETGARAP